MKQNILGKSKWTVKVKTFFFNYRFQNLSDEPGAKCLKKGITVVNVKEDILEYLFLIYPLSVERRRFGQTFEDIVSWEMAKSTWTCFQMVQPCNTCFISLHWRKGGIKWMSRSALPNLFFSRTSFLFFSFRKNAISHK